MCPTFPSLLPLPRLTLRLSTSTILDTVLLDAHDATPLFTVESVGNQTALYLAAKGRLSHVAAIHWPVPASFPASQPHQKLRKDALVYVDGHCTPSSTFLKKSVLGGSRKFHVPGQSHPLKWKHVGSHWECTLCSHACTAHRAVATFEPAHTTSAARLNVYTDGVVSSGTGLHHQQQQYDGVDVDMLAYLVLTSILLTTQPHAWEHTQQSPSSDKHSYFHQKHHPTGSPNLSAKHHPHPHPHPAGSPRVDLLGDDLFPAAHSPLRASPTSQSSSSYSSLPPSPLTPSSDLSPVHHDTFACPSPTVFRRSSNRIPSPLVTTGPGSITPYHLPPTPSPSTPHSSHSHSRHPQPPPQPQRSHTTNALHLDTSHAHVLPYTTQMYNLQFATESTTRQPQSQPQPHPLPPIPTSTNDLDNDLDLPPAYDQIEWTVRVRQPRHPAQLRLHTALAQ